MSFEKTHRACSVWGKRGFSALDKGQMGEKRVAGALEHQERRRLGS